MSGCRVAVLALLIMGMSPVHQSCGRIRAQIRVVVVDRDDLPIVGVTVELTAVAGSSRRIVVSDPKGRARFLTGVTAGDYVAEV